MICAAVAATMNIDSNRVNQSYKAFSSLNDNEKTDIATETFGVYKSLINFSVNENINEQNMPMTFDEYVNFVGGNLNETEVDTMINESQTFKPMSFNVYKNFILNNKSENIIKEEFNKIMKRLDEVKF